MAELIVTTYKEGILAALKEDNRITELHVDREKAYRVGNVYIAKVQNIAKNINAAFVDFGCGINGYLALDRQNTFFYTKQAKVGKCTNGDEILVQLEREAVKTKLPVVTGNINITGRFAVLVTGQRGIVFSRKLHNPSFEKTMRGLIGAIGNEQPLTEECAVIVRTNAETVDTAIVEEEVKVLHERWKTMKQTAPFRTAFSCMYRGDHPFLDLIRDFPMKDELNIVTDMEDFYQDVKDRLPDVQIRMHDDKKLSLTALYSLSTAMERALSKKVWLKSGGDLVIEPTEALTVIDVNTGKCTDKMGKEDFLFRTDMEAAKEIAIQLRLRNLCGIILVDFIDLEEEEHEIALLNLLKKELEKDRVKASFVDMTGLHLAEITRKRVYRPLHEMVRELENS